MTLAVRILHRTHLFGVFPGVSSFNSDDSDASTLDSSEFTFSISVLADTFPGDEDLSGVVTHLTLDIDGLASKDDRDGSELSGAGLLIFVVSANAFLPYLSIYLSRELPPSGAPTVDCRLSPVVRSACRLGIAAIEGIQVIVLLVTFLDLRLWRPGAMRASMLFLATCMA